MSKPCVTCGGDKNSHRPHALGKSQPLLGEGQVWCWRYEPPAPWWLRALWRIVGRST